MTPRNAPRWVVLQFDDGDRFDYEPPLLHPADVFLDRFPRSRSLNADIGATLVFEVDPQALASSVIPEDGVRTYYPPQAGADQTWLADRPEGRA